MSTIIIDTPSFDYSKYSSRFFAFIIDFIILFIINTILAFVLSLEPTEKLFQLGQFLIFRHPLFYVISLLYFTIFEFSSMQATVGKHFLNIIVTDITGERIKISRAFLRNLIKAFLPIIALWFIFSNKNKQLLHDVLAKTIVLRKKSEIKKFPLINYGLIAVFLLIVFYTFYHNDPDTSSNNVLKSYEKENVQDENVSDFLKRKLNQQNEYLLNFAQKDKILWNKFNRDVSNDAEIKENISVLDGLIPLYAEKDSVLITTYKEILNSVGKSIKWRENAPKFIDALQLIISKGTLLASENQKHLLYLRTYYQSLISSDNDNADKYWSLYEKSFDNAQSISNEIVPIITSFTGKEYSKLIDEMEKEYYK